MYEHKSYVFTQFIHLVQNFENQNVTCKKIGKTRNTKGHRENEQRQTNKYILIQKIKNFKD